MNRSMPRENFESKGLLAKATDVTKSSASPMKSLKKVDPKTAMAEESKEKPAIKKEPTRASEKLRKNFGAGQRKTGIVKSFVDKEKDVTLSNMNPRSPKKKKP